MSLVYRQGDTWPPLVIGDPPLDLTGAKATFVYRRRRDGKLIERPLRIIDPKAGKLAAPSRAPAGPVDVRIHWPNGQTSVLSGDIEIERGFGS